jgi:hypothetical protein
VDYEGATANLDELVYSNVQMDKVKKSVKIDELIYADVERVAKINDHQISDQHVR